MREDVRIARRDGRGLIAISVTMLPLMVVIWADGAFQMKSGNPRSAPSLLDDPLFVPLSALLVYFIGLAWMLRIHRRSHLEPETSSWRYRDAALAPGAIDKGLPLWRWDGLRGKALARAMIVFAALLPLVALIGLVAQPGNMGGGMFNAPPWYAVALPWAGAIGYLVGLGWMIRIYRADPEPAQPTWRYRL
jgi:hypothetical protein